MITIMKIYEDFVRLNGRVLIFVVQDYIDLISGWQLSEMWRKEAH